MIADKEEWREIASAPDYMVSSHGRVRRIRPDKLGRMGPEFLATPLNDKGYQNLNLHINGKQHLRRVHILVCDAFHGPRRGRQECRHLDGDKTNNHKDNLRWGSRAENSADKFRHGTQRFGEKCHWAKLRNAEVIAIRASKMGRKELASRFGVTSNHIRRLQLCERGGHI